MKPAIMVVLGTFVVGIWLSTPVLAEIESSVVDALAHSSFHKRKPTLEKAIEAAAAKGATLESLGKVCNLLPIRVEAVLSGQAPLEKKSQDCLENQFGLNQEI